MEETPKQATVFDADQQLLGDVYAKAIVGLGQQNGTLDQLVDELAEVVQVLADAKLKKLNDVLESPRVSTDQKCRFVDDAFAGKVQPMLLNFLKVVAGKNRFDSLSAISIAAQKLRDDLSGKVQATITTAEELSDEDCEKVAGELSKVLGKQVKLTTKVDPQVIGGMVVRVGDTVYDSSVATQLEQVRAKATKAAADAIREKLERFAIA